MKQMQSGVQQENMALGRYKEENKILKTKVDGLSLRLTELEAEVRTYTPSIFAFNTI